MKSNLLIGTLILTVTAFGGCNKTAKPKSHTAQKIASRPMAKLDLGTDTTASDVPSSTGPESAQPVPITEVKARDFGTDGNPNLENLSESLRELAERAQEFPRSTADLIKNQDFKSLPKPPAGKRYVVNPSAGRLELADN